MSRSLLLIVQGGIVVGCLLMLLIVPEIYAKTLGTANETVLPFDYAARLGLMWLGIALVTALVAAFHLRAAHLRAARSRRRPQAD